MMIDVKLNNTLVVADDMKASRHFYEEILGLKLKFADGERWAQYGTGSGNFAIGCAEECPEGLKGAVAVFEVGDLDQMLAAMSIAGIVILERRDMGAHGRVATLADPSGNRLQLFQRLSG